MAENRSNRRAARYVALTGSPGTGKTASAARLPARIAHAEVSDLAVRELGAARDRGAVTVDVPRLGRWIASHPPVGGPTLVVGHLSHLLPIPEVLLLRCHPAELARRLRNRRRLTSAERRENLGAEATDVILFEARGPGRRIWEIDTTELTPAQVGRRITSLIDRPPAPTRRFVDWLADPAVTEHLLDR
ncbi:MAG: adenylate kinase [Thermoplasmata archaeon]|nr:adenylate kinase [Thermoplasmata archaeon]